MALIEGVGDEVTLLFGVLLLLAVLLLAWISTRTCEPPPLSSPAPPPAAGPAPQDTPPAEGPEGPPPAPPPQEEGGAQRNMVVRLKFLNDTERTAQVQPQDTIGYIKRTYFAGQEQQVRLIYRGQLLQDFQTLASLNLGHNGVLHCHVAAAGAGGGGPRPAGPPPALSLGGLMVPLLGLMLAVLWYCQIQYRHFFSAPASASLVGVTLFLSLLAFGVYRR
ncbi:LOW QUALITY PROTEIN: transmembrane and ubiquitin-like domain-containing protein 1 [Menidia menidia]